MLDPSAASSNPLSGDMKAIHGPRTPENDSTASTNFPFTPTRSSNLRAFQDTPIANTVGAKRAFGTNNPHAAQHYAEVAMDIKPYCVGPMPLEEFLAFLPSHNDDKHVLKSAFDGVPEAGFSDEKSLYLPLVSYHDFALLFLL
jgi:hypothetical protein